MAVVFRSRAVASARGGEALQVFSTAPGDLLNFCVCVFAGGVVVSRRRQRNAKAGGVVVSIVLSKMVNNKFSLPAPIHLISE